MAFNVPHPVWRVIQPTHPVSTAAADVFTSMRGQIQSSSQFWQVVQTAATGTNSLLLRCVNPAPIPFWSGTTGTTALTGSDLYVLLANNITGNTAYRDPDSNASAAARIQVGVAIGTGTFEGAQRDLPFSQPSGSLWSGYWVAGTITTLSQTYFVEAQDIIAVGWRETAGNYAAICGAIIEGSKGPDSHRFYGMITNGSTAISSNGWAVTSGYMGHSTSANANHVGIFFPRRGAIVSISTALGNRTAWENVTKLSNNIGATNFVTGSTRIFEPAQCQYVSASSEHTGFYRGIYMTGDLRALESVLDSAGAEVARILGNSRVAAADSFACVPISGSVVSFGPPYFAV